MTGRIETISSVKIELDYIPIDKIDVSEKGNVRKRKISQNLEELKTSLKNIGLQQLPVAVKEGDRYKIIIGQRRFIAATQLGWKKIPVIVRSFENITEEKIASLSENIHRVQLSPRDMSEACGYLIEELGSVGKVAAVLGVTPQTVQKYLGYRIVPEPLKKMVDDKRITSSDAIKISANIRDEKKAIRVAERVSELPRPAKERVFDIVRETPEEPVEIILKKAEEARTQTDIVIHLSEEYATALVKASDDFNLEPEDVVKGLVVEWLEETGYV